MSAELEGARRNAEYIAKVAHPHDHYWMLAQAILLVVQHLEKHE